MEAMTLSLPQYSNHCKNKENTKIKMKWSGQELRFTCPFLRKDGTGGKKGGRRSQEHNKLNEYNFPSTCIIRVLSGTNCSSEICKYRLTLYTKFFLLLSYTNLL